jgi:hypothetical protein
MTFTLAAAWARLLGYWLTVEPAGNDAKGAMQE